MKSKLQQVINRIKDFNISSLSLGTENYKIDKLCNYILSDLQVNPIDNSAFDWAKQLIKKSTTQI